MTIRPVFVIPVVVASTCLAGSPAAGASGRDSISFRATVSGRVHERGSVSSPAAILDRRHPEFNGCGIIKQKHPEILGAYILQVSINRAAFFLGGSLRGAIDLSIADYRPNVATYTSPDIGGRFAMNGHAYGASVTYSTVTIQDGGRSGTYVDSRGSRLQPDEAIPSLRGLTLRLTWHCTTVYHLSEP